MVKRPPYEQIEKIVAENTKLKKVISILLKKVEKKREYMRNYMRKARKEGRIKHWRQYLKEKHEGQSEMKFSEMM